MSEAVDIVINGAGGRMGSALLKAMSGVPDLRLHAALVSSDSTLRGRALPGFPDQRYVAEVAEGAPAGTVLIDFSSPEGLDRAIALATRHQWPLLSGTTGLRDEQRQALDALAAQVPVLWAANTSIGVHLLSVLARQCAKILDSSWDIDIIDVHHHSKRDAPSGTALYLAEGMARARGLPPGSVRGGGHADGTAPRKPEQIHIASLRSGDIVGEHSVLFAAEGERLELVHRAGDRGLFARGALTLARRLAKCPPGRYQPAQLLLPELGKS